MGGEKDSVTIRVEYMVKGLPASTPSKPTIGRANHRIRQVNEIDYEPEIVSIGPIHRGKDEVKSMEQQKVRYLAQLLERGDRSLMEKIVLELRILAEKARLCYPTCITLGEDEFVEMMLLDGCFVIELLRKYRFGDLREKDDEIIESNQTLYQIRHDMMLLENQLPFFVLSKLFNMTKMEDPGDDIYYLLLFFVQDMYPWSDSSKIYPKPGDILHDADHLLGLVYRSCFSFSAKYSTENNCHEQSCFLQIPSASELKKAGIRLKGSYAITLEDIAFEDGVVKLPALTVSDKTESIIRNLIAYEQCFPNDQIKYITDYAFLMHCLIRSAKDVEILRRNGVITNFLGSDEIMCVMINRLGRNVVISSDFCYCNVLARVDRHFHFRPRWLSKVMMSLIRIIRIPSNFGRQMTGLDCFIC